MPACQKRVPDLITDGSEPPCGCWDLNSGPLEEQAMLLTSEPSLQPNKEIFKTAALGSLCYPSSFCLLFSLFVSLNKELDRDMMMFTKS